MLKQCFLNPLPKRLEKERKRILFCFWKKGKGRKRENKTRVSHTPWSHDIKQRNKKKKKYPHAQHKTRSVGGANGMQWQTQEKRKRKKNRNNRWRHTEQTGAFHSDEDKCIKSDQISQLSSSLFLYVTWKQTLEKERFIKSPIKNMPSRAAWG